MNTKTNRDLWLVDLDHNRVVYLPFDIRFTFEFSPADYEADTVTATDFRLLSMTLPALLRIKHCSTRRALIRDAAAIYAEALCESLGLPVSTLTELSEVAA